MSETAKQLCHLLLATTTQISNDLWVLLSYIAKEMFKVVKYKISEVAVEKNFNKRSNRFYFLHTIADSEMLEIFTSSENQQ